MLFEVRLKDVFLSVRPMVLSLAFSTMFSSTTFSFKQAQMLQSGAARRSRPTGQRDQLCFGGAVKNPGRGEFGLYLRVSAASKTFVHQLASCSLDSGDAGVESLGDPGVAPAFARLRDIGLQEDARLRQQRRCRICPTGSRTQADRAPLRSAAQRIS